MSEQSPPVEVGEREEQRVAARKERPRADYDTVIVACGIMSIGIAKMYWAMRIGFDNPLGPIVKSVALALFMYTFPTVATGDLLRGGGSPQPALVPWWRAYPFLWIVGAAVTGALGRAAQATGVNAFPVIAVIGVIAYAIVLIRWLRAASAGRSLTLILATGLFAVWASGVVWGRIYKNPLFYENFILDGNVHHDSLALAALGNMLRTYHAATIGIDGLNYMPYHWGTPWLFAQWSNLTGAHVLDFYQLGFPVTMIPFFFGGTIAFALTMRARRAESGASEDLRYDFKLWFVFLAACLGMIPLDALEAIGTWTSNLLISESYTVAVPCALFMFATAAIFYDGLGPSEDRTVAGSKGSISETVFVLFAAPLGIVALGYLKISLMVLAYAAGIYAVFRLRLYRRWLYAASGVITTILFYLAYTQVSLPAHREGLHPFDFLWSFVQPAWWPFFVLVHLFWSWLYILVRLRSEGIGTIADLREAAAERRIFDVEIVALIAILGLGPGLVTHIDGGSAFYFSDVQRWLAVGLILSRLPQVIATIFGEGDTRPPAASRHWQSRLDSITLRQLVIVFLLIPVVGSMAANSVYWPAIMIRANAETRHSLYPPAAAAAIPLGFHGLLKLHDHATLDEGLRQSRNFAVADALRRLSSIPEAERRQTALFIPQTEGAFWHSLTRPGACTFQPLAATALSSIAMIDGMPPLGCKLSKYYGIGSFAPRQRPQTAVDIAPPVLCRRANAAGLNRVLVMTFPNPRESNVATVDCTSRM